MGTFVKKFISSIFSMKKLIIILCIIGMVIMLAAFKSVIDLESVSTASEIARNELAKSVKIEGKHWVIDEAVYGRVIETAKKQGLDISFWDIDYLHKIIKAELVTNYPNLGDEVDKNDKNKFQGIINFIRKDADGNTLGQAMEYMAQDTFNGHVTNGNYDAIRNYFTIDFGTTQNSATPTPTNNQTVDDTSVQKMQIVIATKSEHNGTVTISTQKIDYKMQVSNYSMPMEFIFAHMQITNSIGYAVAISDLAVSNSKIDYVIQECYSEETIKNIYKYDQKNIQTSGNVTTVTSTTEGITTVQSTETIKNWTVMPYIKEADTWIVNVKNEYEKKETGPTTSNQNEVELPIETTSTYIREKRITYQEVTAKNITYIPILTSNQETEQENAENNNQSNSLENILFIGDSWLADTALQGKFSSSCTFKAVNGEDAAYWNSQTTSGVDNVSAITVMLGLNNTSDIQSMKNLIDKLIRRIS